MQLRGLLTVNNLTGFRVIQWITVVSSLCLMTASKEGVGEADPHSSPFVQAVEIELLNNLLVK